MRSLLFFLLPLSLIAQIPTYYSSIDFNGTPSQVQSDLSSLISTTHTTLLEYTSDDPNDVWDVLMITDLDPTNSEDVLLIYGHDDTNTETNDDRTRDKDDNCTTSSCTGLWNREHVYPRSIADPDLETNDPGPGTDAHNLRACDAQFNGRRSNRLFEDGSGDADITPSGEWYPGDEWKGDVARMMMYMELRYPSQTPANDVASSTNNTHPNMPDVFLEWNAEDPPNQYEIQRNDYLETVQGNRNPFIDNPYLATLIWGGDSAQDNWGLLSIQENNLDALNLKVYPNPTSEHIYFDCPEKPISIQILGANGELIVLDNLKDAKIELPNAKGIYFVVFEFTNQKVYKKVIKR